MRNAPARAYLKELYDVTTYWGSWLPGEATAVGDCGPLQGVIFKNRAKLRRDYRVNFQSGLSDQTWSAIEASSKDGVRILPSVEATTIAGQQKVTVQFEQANRVVFGAAKVRQTSMLNRGRVAKQLADMVRSGAFPPTYVIATDVLQAQSLTALVSRSSNEKVNVTLTVPVSTPIGPAVLAPAIEAAGSSASTIKVIGGRRMTPLFKLMRAPRRPPGNLTERASEIWREHVRTLFSGPNPPRIGYIKVTTNLGTGVAIGQRLEVRPNPGHNITVSSAEGEQLAVATKRWSSLSVEPIVTAGVRDLLGGAGGASLDDLAKIGASAVEFVDAGHTTRGEVHIRFMDDTPLVIEPPNGELIIARPVAPVTVEVKRSHLPLVPTVATAPVEYVDFETVYAASEPMKAVNLN